MSGKNLGTFGRKSLATGPVFIKVFSAERIREIHQRLVDFFAETAEPIRDLGLRDPTLLEQAVSHQFATDEANPLGKPAALLQGLFDELPFHDGNAQQPLIAFLLLLEENGFGPNRVSFDDLFRVDMAAIHEHKLEAPSEARSVAPGRKPRRTEDRSELALILSVAGSPYEVEGAGTIP